MKISLHRASRIVSAFLIAWLLMDQRYTLATTGGDAIISPESQRQLITDWGYDIKQNGKAAGLTSSFAETLFVTDKMTCLRLPIWGNLSSPAHPAGDTVIASYYTDVLTAMTNARAARSNVVLFASKKLEDQNSFPAWVKDGNGVIASQYALMLADFLEFMQINGFSIDVLGIDNEREYNEGNITANKYKDTIDALRALSQTRGFTMPLLIGPETYTPNASWVSNLIAGGWGDRLDIVGTHYYPDAQPKTELKNLFAAGDGRPAWNSEVHWKNDPLADVITEGEQSLAAIFDCIDTGLSGYVWWDYTLTGVKGGLERRITKSTVNSRLIEMDDVDGRAGLGTLITRAFRQGTNIFVWALNNTPSDYTSYGFKLDMGSISGSVVCLQWSTNGSVAGVATLVGTNAFRFTLPARTITEFNFNYLPPQPTAGDSDGDGHLDSFEIANGFDPLTPNTIFIWDGSTSSGVFEESNWSQLGGSNSVLNIDPNTPVNHNLYATNGGLGGGSGFSESLDLGWRTFSKQRGFLRGQPNAGVRGAPGGRLRLGGTASGLFKFLDTIRAETTETPQITFYTINAFSGGATLNILGNSSPKIIVEGTTPQAVEAQFLPSLYVAGQPAHRGNVQLSVVNSTNVQILRLGDSDDDGASDVWEWEFAFNASDPSDGALDPDNDGVPNWLESRFGTPPYTSSSGIFLNPPEIQAGAEPRLRFGPGGTQLLYRLWQTPVLGQPWSILGTVNSGSLPAPFYEIIHTNPPVSASYYRIEVLPTFP